MRHWRRERRMSQLGLAGEAGVTQRHVSFVESGRANPSREMVLALARALDVPLRERNQMLLAAGYAPHYRETGLDESAMAQVQRGARPAARPAGAVPRRGDGPPLEHAADQRRRRTAMFGFLLDGAAPEPANVVRLMFTRAAAVRRELRADRRGADPARPPRGGRRDPGPAKTVALLDEVARRPACRPRGGRRTSRPRPRPSLPVRFAKDGVDVSYFSLVTTVGTPQDVTLQEIRVESFFPADERRDHRWT